MSVKVVITGIGLVSALGKLESTWKEILSGHSGICLHQPFPENECRPLALIGTKPVELIKLTRQVLADAIIDADLCLPLPDCGLVIGSSRGNQARLEQFAREGRTKKEKGIRKNEEEFSYLGEEEEGKELLITNYQLPITNYQLPITNYQFLDCLPHAGAIAAANFIGTRGPVLAPAAACATGIWAIAQGFELIQTGQCDRVIAGAVEAPITPLTLAGFNQMGALAQTGAYPFDSQREGFVLGEGAALLVLESAELAKRRGAKIYGQVLGFGLTNDACYANSPDLGGKSAIAAIEQCLSRSKLSVNDIDYIHAHGTATQLNDRHEAMLIEKLFPHGVAVSSTKGATGHTLGASGALGTAFCLMSIKDQIMPPCVGLRDSLFKLDLVRAARRREVRNTLCFSFGFGGQNAVIALGRYR
ncbi:beta-ketoacyl-ACP synthase [Kamptonema sp. UHCC 0994]|uniref:beta-ketoacyl-ACP synthase n=1 Tax=Kamptonema sp. UHCC 0994 TaxID=3031329 RepID=UPI0023B8AC39|nr:beta-ketoacyl-ACP synthase [Kamptonema sp. UHCC 0994]MDF0554993.1 beta-ketoacyl-ACP synthase [Kamptonema sp. UHCC 0994]